MFFLSSFELCLFQVLFYTGRNIVTIKQTFEDETIITRFETSETKSLLAQCYTPEELIPRKLYWTRTFQK